MPNSSASISLVRLGGKQKSEIWIRDRGRDQAGCKQPVPTLFALRRGSKNHEKGLGKLTKSPYLIRTNLSYKKGTKKRGPFNTKGNQERKRSQKAEPRNAKNNSP